ncbi:peptidase S41 family [Cordyceps militaris]|uniref:Peptidase S41 family n=1 Tax=Cordyceps militaris TaxID=73501 RepID=A0A2H4SWB0_CORMI|nr:peptidase S41 family [Cordyceps militaris]
MSFYVDTSQTNFNKEAPWKPEDIFILTDGTCASACSIFTGLMWATLEQAYAGCGRCQGGGVKGTEEVNNADNKGIVTNFVEELQRSRDGQVLFEVIRGIPSTQDPSKPLPTVASSTFATAANCRLFYTRDMMVDVTESWRQAAKIAWGNGTSVRGSTVPADGRIGEECAVVAVFLSTYESSGFRDGLKRLPLPYSWWIVGTLPK